MFTPQIAKVDCVNELKMD